MKESFPSIKVEFKKGVFLTIYTIGKNAQIFEIEPQEAEEFGEATIQILESKRYEYEFSDKAYQLVPSKEFIPSNSETTSRGIIAPGNYVGTLELNIINKSENETLKYHLEVLATKFDSENNFDKSYRENYRSMVEDITEKCTELLMQSNSPVNQYFEPDFTKGNKIIYQKFSFVKSVIGNDEFEASIMRIFSGPKTNWINRNENVDIRSIKKFTNKNVKELIKGTNRMPLPKQHSLYNEDKLTSVPIKINSYKQEPSLDTPENRFIKHALETYLQFCENCSSAFEPDSKDQKEADYLANTLENYLNHSFFKEVSRPTTLKLNSPTLQRKSGYRQILKSWLMFDLASKLTWTGAQDDDYIAGKRDIATLYEYWLFFVLYDLFKSKFNLSHLEHEGKPYEHLFETTKSGLNLIIKSGRHTALRGSSIIKNRALNIKFSFNRTFSGNKDSFPKAGSWTTAMRPDYTLTIWPKKLTETKAEIEEQIVHIHFDAKYKVNHFNVKTNDTDLELSKEEEEEVLNKIKKEERAGKYKNADLLKMHAYKDAIRRTGGAYILYPGTKQTRFKGFHELIPGLGAFAINPNNEKENIEDLSNFIDKVINHLVNRASQRENIASKTYEITKDGKSKPLNEPLPEYVNNKKLIPDETYVLVGYAKSELRKERMEWFHKEGKYNFRMNDEDGALHFTEKEAKAEFLLIRESKDGIATNLYKLKKGIKVYTGSKLEADLHPDAKKDAYLVVEFESDIISEFKGARFDCNDTKEYKELEKKYKNPRIRAGIPFTTTLTELMNVKIP
ncbi:hypothetical protein DFQ11_1011030 [Winogradskyella epiphytica]|uniref:DUF2357 domain-containing protein n=1 Tax=Winogradskyella epiphytica TaxID=262005 RepID=A0A2V4X119_9FLAO|nr:DUF2357 domain-containing protein [Winogradskyella epiphytica]PYE83592.1 hypothetical protein DFQ11_1011030 [Winogradskyella epiphytica]GGW59253.1 hypothetical protein GCM10008085_08840 [Winogradskyella epiphytica]